MTPRDEKGGALGARDDPVSAAGVPAGWNDTRTEYERDATITEVVLARVGETPDAVALADGERTVTYAELDEASRGLAGRLGTLIDGSDRCVGVLAERSIDSVLASFGVLRAGAAFVPLEPDLPDDRLRFIIGDAALRAVVAPDRLASRCARLTDVPGIPISGSSTVPLAEPPATGPRSLAYVMYTSGSSGRPKGVEVEHRGVLRYVRGARGIVPERSDTVLHAGRLGFDASTYEMWGALCNGARLAVHRGERFDPVEVAETILGLDVTLAFFATGALHEMIDAALPALGRLRAVLAGGDVMSPGHARRLRAAHPQTRLINTYGPTEATVTASVHEVTDVPAGESVPIGRPLANTTLYVLDPEMRTTNAGDVGELWIGGDGVARGYVGLPEETALRFVPDPFGDDPAGRLYRTGDAVRMRATGDLEFVGRLDDQVKIRGYRVEPAEVAAVLSGHPAVSAAAVVPREDVAGHARLVAYVTATYPVDTHRLRRYLRRQLPEPMVPSAIVVVDRLPRTANGKVDRAALPPPPRSTTNRAPRDETERSLARLWGEVLQYGDPMLDDDFFDAGGDSLLALQLVGALREELGIEVSLGAVFEDRTLMTLAARVRVASSVLALPPLVPLSLRSGTPASVSQAQACFLSALASSALPYQAQAMVSFEGQLDHSALGASLQTIVDRHDVLRTEFRKEGGTWVQRIQPQAEVDLDVVDVADEAELDALFARRAGARIDLARLPLIRFVLARLPNDRAALIQVEHHVVHDGWSFATALRELAALYNAHASGRPNPLPPLDVQYADFAAWQLAFAGTPAGKRQLEYWSATLADAPPPLRLPADRPHPPLRDHRGASLRTELSPELADGIRQTAAGAGCTPFALMAGAFVTLLARLSNEVDIVIGSGLANRRVPGTEALIGMFVNTVALRVDVADNPPSHTVMSRIQAATLDAFANQELPFEEVVRALSPERQSGESPFYNHLFSFHDTPFPDLDLEGIDVRVVDTLSNGSAKADLNVVVVNRRGEDMTVVWEFATDVFDAATAQALLDAYLTVLTSFVSHPELLISDIALTDAEHVLAGSAHAAPYERDATVDRVFAERVADNPGAPAIISSAGTVSYADLDRASDAFAAALRRAGVGPGDCVGVVDDRCAEMVAALLGILKSGAAYVGLDRATPTPRLTSMLKDAAMTLAWARGDDVQWLAAEGVGCLSPDPSPTPEQRPDRTATDLAYVAFTSGSTGAPKGVEVTHRGVVRLVRGTDYASFGPQEIVLGNAPLAFDASTFEIWGALLNGGCLVLAPPTPLSPAQLAEVIVDHGVTTAWFTAPLFHAMVDHELAALAGCRQVLAGGDVLSPAHVNRLLGAIGADGCVINGYGPTEGTTFTCCHRMTAGTVVEGPVPIGRPVANTWAVVVDDVGHPVPDGVAGELWIGGDGVARGYASQPDVTAERFLPNPFTPLPGDSIYKSGDRVRRRPGGPLEYLGRIDRQVKIRGHRVEPAEIEAVTAEHPAVGGVHVLASDYGPDDRRLIAYVVAAGTDRPTDELRGFLQGRLPRHMVPTEIVWIDALPLLPSGKVDPGRLPAPADHWFPPGEVTPEATLARPTKGAGRLEHVLLGIWQDVTGTRDATVDDDFFALGGHSLLAVQLLDAIEVRTGARLPLATVFESPTPRSMATLLRSEGWDAKSGSLVPVTATGTRPPLFAVTAGDGNVVGYGPLARRLGADQPFYVLQPFGLDSTAPLHRSVEAMARRYVREIRAVQPHGPYFLLGRCFGSLIAYEMTVRLEAAGQEVALLMSIDSVGPLWTPRSLADGTPYDPVMNMARVLAEGRGHGVGPIFSNREAARSFVGWLGEPDPDAEGAISRYVNAAYRSRPDLQSAFPLSRAGSVDGIHYWTWVGGRTEMGMQEALLPAPTPAARAARPSLDPRLRTRPTRAADRALDWINFATAGRIAGLARRRRDDILRVAAENLVRYRGAPVAAPIVLVRPPDGGDGHQGEQVARWYGLETGGVTEVVVQGSHHTMLREPAVASLAECITRLMATSAAS